MKSFDEMQSLHEALLTRLDRSENKRDLLEPVKSFLNEIAISSSDIADHAQRESLRANLRFWSAFIFEQSDEYPQITLRPINPRLRENFIELRMELQQDQDIQLLSNAIQKAKLLDAEGALDDEFRRILKQASDRYSYKMREQGSVTAASVTRDLDSLYRAVTIIQNAINGGEKLWFDSRYGEFRSPVDILNELQASLSQKTEEYVLREFQKINSQMMSEEPFLEFKHIKEVLEKHFIQEERKQLEFEEKLERVKESMLVYAEERASFDLGRLENNLVRAYKYVIEFLNIFPSSRAVHNAKKEIVNKLIADLRKMLKKVSPLNDINIVYMDWKEIGWEEIGWEEIRRLCSEILNLCRPSKSIMPFSPLEIIFAQPIEPENSETILFKIGEELSDRIKILEEFQRWWVDQFYNDLYTFQFEKAEEMLKKLELERQFNILDYPLVINQYSREILGAKIEEAIGYLAFYRESDMVQFILTFKNALQLEEEIGVISTKLSILAKENNISIQLLTGKIFGKIWTIIDKRLSLLVENYISNLLSFIQTFIDHEFSHPKRLEILDAIFQITQSRFGSNFDDELKQNILNQVNIVNRNTHLLNMFSEIRLQLNSTEIWEEAIYTNDFKQIESLVDSADTIVKELDLSYMPIERREYDRHLYELQKQREHLKKIPSLISCLKDLWKQLHDQYLLENFDNIRQILFQIQWMLPKNGAYQIFYSPKIQSKYQLLDPISNEWVTGWEDLDQWARAKNSNLEHARSIEKDFSSLLGAFARSVDELKINKLMNISLPQRLLESTNIREQIKIILEYLSELDAQRETMQMPLSNMLQDWKKIKAQIENILEHREVIDELKEDSGKVIALKQELIQMIRLVEEIGVKIDHSIETITMEINFLGGFPNSEDCLGAIKKKKIHDMEDLLQRARMIGAQNHEEEKLIAQLDLALEKSKSPFWKFWN